MHDHPKIRRGFGVIEIVIGLAAIVAIAALAYFTYTWQQSNRSATLPVRWSYNDSKQEWMVKSGVAPACRDPYVFDYSPIDVAQVTSVAMPGVYRGYSYKPHGGFRLDSSPDGKIDVRVPTDAKLVGLTRYYEGEPAELQYLLTFESDCGIAFRFDHLNTLTPKFQAIAEQTEPPKLNDTRADPSKQPAPVDVKAGELVATAIGFPRMKNFGFDFGVYDYRQRNEISKNQKWSDIHKDYSSLDWHGVCWFDMMPGKDAAATNALSKVQVDSRKPFVLVSDYCPAPQTTLDYNDGQAVEGY